MTGPKLGMAITFGIALTLVLISLGRMTYLMCKRTFLDLASSEMRAHQCLFVVLLASMLVAALVLGEVPLERTTATRVSHPVLFWTGIIFLSA